MPRPITKADIKRWRGWYEFRAYTDDRLGIFFRRTDLPPHIKHRYCYSVDANDAPCWVTKKTLERRKKLGHPAKRKARSILPDSMFSLDEMDLACSIMEELS